LKGEGPNVEFVEIEDDSGKSINVGTREKYGEFTKLKIDMESAGASSNWDKIFNKTKGNTDDLRNDTKSGKETDDRGATGRAKKSSYVGGLEEK